MSDTPSILIIGVPNGSTSIVAKLYHELGWHYMPDHRPAHLFMENAWLGEVTKLFTGQSSERQSRARAILRERIPLLTRPFVLKDHRLSWMLEKVQDTMLSLEPNCRLVLVQKPLVVIRRSTKRRLGPERGWRHRSPEKWWRAAQQRFEGWPGQRRKVDCDTLRRTVAAGDVAGFLEVLAVGRDRPPADRIRAAMDRFDPTRDEPSHPSHGKDGWER